MGDKDLLGYLKVCIWYDEATGMLNTNNFEGKQLIAMDINGFSDPYIKAYMWEGGKKDSKSKRKSRVKKKTLNPVFDNEAFTFPLQKSQLASKTLELSVWDYDFAKANDFIGQVRLELSDVPTAPTPDAMRWYKLASEKIMEPAKAVPDPGLTELKDKDKLDRKKRRASFQFQTSLGYTHVLRGFVRLFPHRKRTRLTKSDYVDTLISRDWSNIFLVLTPFELKLYEIMDNLEDGSFIESVHFSRMNGISKVPEELDGGKTFCIEYRKIDSKDSSFLFCRAPVVSDKDAWMAAIEKQCMTFRNLTTDLQQEDKDMGNNVIRLPTGSLTATSAASYLDLVTAVWGGKERVLLHNDMRVSTEYTCVVPSGSYLHVYLENGEKLTIKSSTLQNESSASLSIGGMKAVKVKWQLQKGGKLAKVKKMPNLRVDAGLGVVAIAAGAAAVGYPATLMGYLFYLVCLAAAVLSLQSFGSQSNGYSGSDTTTTLTMTFSYVDDTVKKEVKSALIVTEHKKIHCKEWGAYGDADHEGLKLRAPHYLSDKIKRPAPPYMFQLRNLDFFECDTKPVNMTTNNEWVKQYRQQVPPVTSGDPVTTIKNMIFCINWQVPASPWWELGCYFVLSPDAPPDSECKHFYDGMWAFLEGDKKYRDSHFKLIPRVIEGNWIVKQGVGSTPAILGNKLKQEYHYDKTNNVFEVEVDVSSSAVAGKILGLVKGAAKSLVIDLSFLLEGKEIAHLPEVLIGGARMSHIDLNKLPKVDLAR